MSPGRSPLPNTYEFLYLPFLAAEMIVTGGACPKVSQSLPVIVFLRSLLRSPNLILWICMFSIWMQYECQKWSLNNCQCYRHQGQTVKTQFYCDMLRYTGRSFSRKNLNCGAQSTHTSCDFLLCSQKINFRHPFSSSLLCVTGNKSQSHTAKRERKQRKSSGQTRILLPHCNPNKEQWFQRGAETILITLYMLV